jgi:hypothetical protein
MFSVSIREEVDKYAKRIAGKDKQIRFSPALFRVAMKIRVRSPAAYEDMRKSSWIMSLPSQQQLRDMHHETMVDEGECVSLYARFATNCMIVGTILYGLVMCDEMKLDENVLWDTKSHIVHGFAGDFESLDWSI